MRRDANPKRMTIKRGNCQRDAVYSDTAFLDRQCGQIRRQFNLDDVIGAFFSDTQDAGRAVDVAGNEVSVQSLTKNHRALHVDAVPDFQRAEVRAVQSLIQQMELYPA